MNSKMANACSHLFGRGVAQIGANRFGHVLKSGYDIWLLIGDVVVFARVFLEIIKCQWGLGLVVLGRLTSFAGGRVSECDVGMR